jgi:hypothetical protein
MTTLKTFNKIYGINRKLYMEFSELVTEGTQIETLNTIDDEGIEFSVQELSIAYNKMCMFKQLTIKEFDSLTIKQIVEDMVNDYKKNLYTKTLDRLQYKVEQCKENLKIKQWDLDRLAYAEEEIEAYKLKHKIKDD